MDFYRALAARYAHPLHLAFGGISLPSTPIGDQLAKGVTDLAHQFGGKKATTGGNTINQALPNTVSQPINQVTQAPIAQADKAITNATTGGSGNPINAILDPFKANMPTDTFQATTPDIHQMDFASPANGGLQQIGAGYNDLGQSFSAQQGLAQQAGQTLGAQQGLYGQQQGLADALLAQSQGRGPNPAQEQFQQNENQAIQQQAGALASTRGINPALAARMAAQQGASMQQGAAGQAAVLQAQQQLGAQQALGAQQQAMGQNLLGQNSTMANQGNLYGQAAGTAGAIGGLGSSLYGTAAGANNAQDNALINASLGAQGINAGVAAENANIGVEGQRLGADVAKTNALTKAGLAGGVLNAGGGILGGMLAGGGGAAAAGAGGAAMAGGSDLATMAPIAATAAHGGDISDQRALALAHALMSIGGSVPGQAKVRGDSSKNDTVPAVLSPHEIVLPRSVSMAEDAPEKAAEFVAKLKGKEKKSGAKGYGKILEKHREVQKHLADLEAIIKRQAS